MRATLFLVRHGVAEDSGPRISDAERALTDAGARKTTRAAFGLRRLRTRPDAILASPLRRARQTAEQLGQVLCPDVRIETYLPLAPGHGPDTAVHGLLAYRGASQLILVGHLPGIGELVSYLLCGSPHAVCLDFGKGAVAAIDFASLPPKSPGVLRWFMTSKQLRVLGRQV